MGKGRSRAPSQRQLRVGEEIRHALAWILERGEVRDPALQGVTVTVTEVRANPDLKNATAYVVPLGGGDAAALVPALTRAAPYLRHLVAEKVRLRYTPTLHFEADESFDNADRISTLLHSPAVARDLEPHDPEAAGGEEPGDHGA